MSTTETRMPTSADIARGVAAGRLERSRAFHAFLGALKNAVVGLFAGRHSMPVGARFAAGPERRPC